MLKKYIKFFQHDNKDDLDPLINWNQFIIMISNIENHFQLKCCDEILVYQKFYYDTHKDFQNVCDFLLKINI
jgi:hypothetical protein